MSLLKEKKDHTQLLFFRPEISSNLRALMTSKIITKTILTKEIYRRFCCDIKHQYFAIPGDLKNSFSIADKNVTTYDRHLKIPACFFGRKETGNLLISDAQFITDFDFTRLTGIISRSNPPVLCVNISAKLLSRNEHTRISGDNVIGFRRLYDDAFVPCLTPHNWPHHIIAKPEALKKAFNGQPIPMDFAEFVEKCRKKSLGIVSLTAAGTVLDLHKDQDLLRLARQQTIASANTRSENDIQIEGNVITTDSAIIYPPALIVGPAIIAENVTIGPDAIIRSSIIGPNTNVQANALIHNSVYTEKHHSSSKFVIPRNYPHSTTHLAKAAERFKSYPIFSYPRFFKRALDIIFSTAVLIFFAPIFLIIAMAVKITSKGPVLYKARRQGRGGKEFDCFKFRSMNTNADSIQENLMDYNQVDGPQFKISNDPRITIIGKFMRDTSIDEIPQFINVLFGQMSVIGPRPSPKEENQQCPSWHDARLSIRPGITGLWQIYRTRLPGRDFQEWIYFDTDYVKTISFLLDVKITFLTAKMLIKNFFTRVFKNALRSNDTAIEQTKTVTS